MHRDVRIFGVPLDLGARRLGVDMGPTAIRYANLIGALNYNGIACRDHGDVTATESLYRNAGGGDGCLRAIAEVSERLAALVHAALEEGCIPVILGGDHSASIGSIAGVAKRARRPGLLWLDYHPDANTPETSPSGNIHGMTVAISLGYGPEELVGCAGFRPKIQPQDICMIGINDIDRGEKTLLSELGVRYFTLMDIERQGIVRVLDEALRIVSAHTDMVHVSLDVDVLDPLIAPGTGIISRGGMSYREISYVMKTLGEEGVVDSIDVIEVNPLLDIRNTTAELAVELLIASLGGSFGDYERNYLQAHRK